MNQDRFESSPRVDPESAALAEISGLAQLAMTEGATDEESPYF